MLKSSSLNAEWTTFFSPGCPPGLSSYFTCSERWELVLSMMKYEANEHMEKVMSTKRLLSRGLLRVLLLLQGASIRGGSREECRLGLLRVTLTLHAQQRQWVTWGAAYLGTSCLWLPSGKGDSSLDCPSTACSGDSGMWTCMGQVVLHK